MTLASLGADSAFDGNQRFAQLSHRLSEMVAREGLKIVPFYNPELIYFSSLRVPEQKRVLSQLETLLVIGQQIQERGEKVRSVKSLTWAFLKHFQCTAPSDLINYLNEGDLVNAYGTSHKLLYASFSFFEVFTYSLEDFYCRPWMELFERDDQKAHEQLEALANEILAGEHSKVKSMSFIPEHRCTETTSPGRVSIWLQSQYCAPIFSQGDIIGYLGAHRYTPMPTQALSNISLSLG